jgi:ectoine hydroxylase-related dioxygenase (phytanoyl-CoA dioxygenase family)
VLTETDLLPTSDDVAFYQKHGWYIAGPIVPAELIDRARKAIDAFYDGRRDYELPHLADVLGWDPSQGDVLRLNSYVSLQMNTIAELVRLPIIGRIASILTSSASIRLFRDSVFYKPPSAQATTTIVGWHTDAAYWKTCTAKDMLTAWIPLHDIDETMGGLVLMDGSHRWPDNSHLRTSEEQNLAVIETQFHRGSAPIVEIPIRLRKGQLSFHDCRVVHGSRENAQPHPRVTVTVHMQTADNRYQNAIAENGRELHHMNDFVCRQTIDGTPDYTDPAVFPVLWPQG